MGYKPFAVYVMESDDEINKFHRMGYGADNIVLTKDEYEALAHGKRLAYYDGEYTYTIELEGD